MSFSSTPLGQDRPLHQTFSAGGSEVLDHSQRPTSPPKRVSSIINSVPLSYAYGAPTSVSRPTNKPGSPGPLKIDRLGSNYTEEGTEEDELLLSRYTQLKERNQSLANRPGSALGPGIITTPPQPTGATLKDTSVNIASAFHQAASSYTAQAMATTGSWVNSRVNIPRSTSIEYEKEAQSASHRRLAAPPSRSSIRTGGGSKPSSKTGSATRGSDIENEHSREMHPIGRAKSPFDHLADITKRAMAPAATFLMRQRSQEPEDIQVGSRQATDITLVMQNNNSTSYDYADEEEQFEQMQKSAKRNAATHKRNRMSMDNKAYRPTVSDLEEESDDEMGDDKKGRRRRKKKDSAGGGPLRTLPVAQYDKRKKKRGRNGRDDDSGSDVQDQELVSEQRSARSNTPLQKLPSHQLESVPPQYGEESSIDKSADTEQGLDSIPEVDEHIEPIPPEPALPRVATHGRTRSRSRSRTRTSRAFSVGSFLGLLVNLCYRVGHGLAVIFFRLLAIITHVIGKIIGTIVDLFLRQPVLFINRRRRSLYLASYLLPCVAMYFMWSTLQQSPFQVPNLSMIGQRPRSSYPNIETIPGNFEEIATRLLELENWRADTLADIEHERQKLNLDLLKVRDAASRVDRLEKTVTLAQRVEEESRIAAFKSLENLQREIRALQSEWASFDGQGSRLDDEAKSKLRLFEDRLGSIEYSVKDAIELGQNALKASSAIAAASSGASWWSKVGVGSNSAIMLKTSDGQDVTSLIDRLVKDAVTFSEKDDLARVDYAFYSGGANVIPSLTSPTYEIPSSYFYGLITGTSVYARSPVTALHHDLHLGYCWPFRGSKGQLGVKLASLVHISDFTIDHVAREVAHDMRSAPRYMEVWGLVEGEENLGKFKEYSARKQQERAEAQERGETLPVLPTYPSTLPKSVPYMHIASFTYDIHDSSNIQTFSVPEEVQDLGIDFGIIVLMIDTNWGLDDFTCLYRFRVHGSRAYSLPAPDP